MWSESSLIPILIAGAVLLILFFVTLRLGSWLIDRMDMWNED
jgi:hypothetical protein